MFLPENDLNAGQLICLGGHFEKATFGGGSYFLSEIEANLG